MCRKDSFKLLQKIEFVQSILKKKTMMEFNIQTSFPDRCPHLVIVTRVWPKDFALITS